MKRLAWGGAEMGNDKEIRIIIIQMQSVDWRGRNRDFLTEPVTRVAASEIRRTDAHRHFLSSFKPDLTNYFKKGCFSVFPLFLRWIKFTRLEFTQATNANKFVGNNANKFPSTWLCERNWKEQARETWKFE